jgi:uncharacterized protein YqgV (UPF0045/DUF77 family)
MISAEVSIYPLKTTQASSIINEAINTLDNRAIDYNVGSISTYLHGTEEEVWSNLQKMFSNAGRSGEVSMVVTITNSAK